MFGPKSSDSSSSDSDESEPVDVRPNDLDDTDSQAADSPEQEAEAPGDDTPTEDQQSEGDSAGSPADEQDSPADEGVWVESTVSLQRSKALGVFSIVVGALLLGITFLWWRYGTGLQSLIWLVLALGEFAVATAMMRRLSFTVRVGEAGVSNSGHRPWSLTPEQFTDTGVQPGKFPTLWVMPTSDAPSQSDGYAAAMTVPKGAKLAPLDPELADNIERELVRLRFAAPLAAAEEPVPASSQIAEPPADEDAQDDASSGASRRFADSDADDDENYVPRYARVLVEESGGEPDDVPMSDWPTAPMRAMTPEVLDEIKDQLDRRAE